MSTTSYETTILAIIDACVREMPERVRSHANRFLPLAITVPGTGEGYELVTVDAFTGRGTSVKPGNAVLDLRRLVKLACAIAIDGAAAYELPYLTIPAVIKALLDVGEVFKVDLSAPAAGAMVAIHELLEADEEPTRERVGEAAQRILRGWGRADGEEAIDEALEGLVRLGCVQRSNGRYGLAERVVITHPR
jgi:hypothetical protein